MDGRAVEKSVSPAALAARTGTAQPPTELVAVSADGQKRCVVIHARAVREADGVIDGVLCSVTDISEQRRLENEVGVARDNRAGFLHVLAHELRNPLAPVMAVAAILRRQPGELGIARMARVIERQTTQLARFIDDLLEGSRIDQACEIPVSIRATGVDEVLARARDVVDCLLRERGQRLHLEIGIKGQMRDIVLWCDPDRLGQALGNALLNASQFSDNGAGISLSVAVDGVFLEMLVSDDGIGVEADELPLMFEPFRKFAAHPGRVESGTGLGLAIARSVARAHGGIVSADSAGRGQGTRLRFVLPVVDAVSG
jgi:signal transduction histidine kinase